VPGLDLDAQVLDRRRIVLQWGAATDAVVKRSARQSGGFEEIADLQTVSRYVDTPPKNGRRDETYYQVEAGGQTLGPVAPGPPVGHKTAHIRRQTERHLRRVGEKMHLFEEKEGERCPDCWDEVRRVRKRSDCDTCGGNGYIGGWSAPIGFRACIGAGEPEPKETQGGEIETLQLKAWTGAYPEVDIGDHLVRDRDREVFRVVKRRPTKRKGHDLRQNLILKFVEQGASARAVADKVS
jgi:hypothetical protein